MTKAIGQVGNLVLERQLLAQAVDSDVDQDAEEHRAQQAVAAVADFLYQQGKADCSEEPGAARQTIGSAN